MSKWIFIVFILLILACDKKDVIKGHVYKIKSLEEAFELLEDEEMTIKLENQGMAGSARIYIQNNYEKAKPIIIEKLKKNTIKNHKRFSVLTNYGKKLDPDFYPYILELVKSNNPEIGTHYTDYLLSLITPESNEFIKNVFFNYPDEYYVNINYCGIINDLFYVSSRFTKNKNKFIRDVFEKLPIYYKDKEKLNLDFKIVLIGLEKLTDRITEYKETINYEGWLKWWEENKENYND